IFLAALTASAATLSACGSSTPTETPPPEGAAIGGDFTLVDKDGKTVHFNDFAGKYRIVYFGYSFCPDVCPLDLQHVMQGYHSFAKDHADSAKKVQPIFVTIDPARDTPQVVGQFAANFGPESSGSTGSEAQVAQAAKAFAVYYQKRPGTAPDAYSMDHSRGVYSMAPDGKPIASSPGEKDGKAVAADLAKWVR
ncbi:hypothetical protein OY671_009356, partial [Metschnikowia pulcherrima]